MISHWGISVITPLPFGEGKGEGPAGEGGGASWGRGRGQLGKGEGPPLVGILTMQTGNVKIFHRQFSSTIEKRPSMQQEHALLHTRICSSCHKKGVFYEQEGHILECKT